MVYAIRVNLSVGILCMVRRRPKAVFQRNLTGEEGYHDDSYTETYCEKYAALRDIAETHEGEFDWDKSTISQLLSMFFYGYICTQVLSGWFASRFGGTRFWGWNMLASGLFTMLTPMCARISVYLLYFIRMTVGVTSGVAFPCIHAILGQWAPPHELSKMAALIYAGIAVGNVVTLASSALLCLYGWPTIFYLSGFGTIVWSASWLYLTTDIPGQNRWISDEERTYIEATIGRAGIKKVLYVPWMTIMTSAPVWATISAHFTNNYVYFTMITLLPTFLDESLNFDLRQSGQLSSLPYISEFFTALFVGYVADTITHNELIPTTRVRKTFQTIAFLGTAICMISVAQLDCERRYLAVVLLCFSTAFMTFNRAGFVVNHLDLAPGYAGILFGLTNTAGTLPGMIAPVIAGYLTPNKTSEEWKGVFYICALDAMVGAVLYLVLADGELQWWAQPPEAFNMKKDQSDSRLDNRVSQRRFPKLLSTQNMSVSTVMAAFQDARLGERTSTLV
ncbi:hypothetical protein Btru_039832 [Bulinus truncatus]|nr:hypothetical protein Btru_039832 [Bulinus truncatus]